MKIFPTGAVHRIQRVCVIFLLACPLASAQTVPIQAPQEVVEVTAEGVPESASSSSVTVLTREDIEERHAIDFADLLSDVPFLHVAQNGSRGSLTSLTIRGGKPNFSLFLIDGTPINDISDVLGGSVDLSSISPDNVERVEIMRGPLSSVYGSDAVAGVVNIISRSQTTAPVADLDLQGGNFGTGRFGFNLGNSTAHTSYGLTGSYLNVSEQVLDDEFALGTIAGNFRREIDTKNVFIAHVRYEHDQDSSFPENGGGPELSILREPQLVHSGSLTLDAAYDHQVRPSWLSTLNVNYFQRGARSSIPAILDAVPPTANSLPSQEEKTMFRRGAIALNNHWAFSSKLSGRLALGFHDENGTNNDILAGVLPSSFHLDRPAFDGNGELVYSTARFTASAGTGVNKSRGFNAHPASRVGANLRMFGSRATLKGSWGSAYKLPSMFALGDPNVGNPALLPERSRGFDVGVEGRFEHLRTRATITYFWNSFKDLIDFSATDFKLVNRSSAHTQGVELSSITNVSSRLSLGGDVSYLDWKLEGTTEPLRDVPHWESGISAHYRLAQRFRLGANTRWMGRRFDFQVPAPFIDSVGGYSRTDVTADYELSRRVTTYAAIDNVFNRRYHEFLGFPNPGIYGRVGMKIRLLQR